MVDDEDDNGDEDATLRRWLSGKLDTVAGARGG